MADNSAHAPVSGVDYESLAEQFRPIFDHIAEGAVERERTRQLPYEPIKWLKSAGFGALRVPHEYGGGGISIPHLFRLLIELGEADANLPQAFRGHFAFVEDQLNAPESPQKEAWLKRFVAGDLVGNAWTEIGDVKLGDVLTWVSPYDKQWRLNGTKYYSTGAVFADWIDVYAKRTDTKTSVIAVVNTHQPGVRLLDDWDGFGQRTTGSGSTFFDNAVVEAGNVTDFSERFKYQTAFYQLVLLSVLAGTGRAITRDVSRYVASRKRIYSHGNKVRIAQDPQIQQVVGKIAAQAYAAESITIRAAEAAQRAYESHFSGDAALEKSANIEAELESAKAQLIAADLVIGAASDLFNALGASAAAAEPLLDRHWRNVRTVASHNPLIYKARIVGDWLINGTEPPFIWQIGAIDN